MDSRVNIVVSPGGHVQVAHSWDKRGMTEMHPAVPIIDIISPFQVHGIYLDTFLPSLLFSLNGATSRNTAV